MLFRSFYSTPIPVCLWIINRNKKENPNYRSREKEFLFIDARNLGQMVDRRHRELNDEDIQKVADTYHQWRNIDGNYENKNGFCQTVTLADLRENEYVLTPSRYVGISDVEDEDITFDEKMTTLTAEISELFSQSKSLEVEIRKNLGGIGYEFE